MGERLIVNLGSSRVAWRGLGATGSAPHHDAPGRVLMQALAGRPPPDEVVVGSVARTSITADFLAMSRSVWGIEARELVSGADAYGVHNGYARPASLGVDRWAAVVAAYYAKHDCALIADCGTAITVDYVGTDGRHAGGLIAPGLHLMRRVLVEGTRLELATEPEPHPPGLGTSTEEAVAAGILNAAEGLIAKALTEATVRYGVPSNLVLTGGDAPTLLARLGSPWRVEPDLVLDGLELLAGIEP